jgi:hypothetical protein
MNNEQIVPQSSLNSFFQYTVVVDSAISKRYNAFSGASHTGFIVKYGKIKSFTVIV